MKKFMLIVLAVVVAATVTYAAAGRSSEGLVDKAENAALNADIRKVEVYAKGESQSFTYTGTGAFNVYTCDLAGAGTVLSDVDGVLGAAVFYDGRLTLSDVLEEYGATAISIEEGENCTLVYAYAKGCGRGVVSDGRQINMQIVLKEDATVVGSPLVMGSY